MNKPWLDEAIARGDQFRFVSNPASEEALFVTTGKAGKKAFVFADGTAVLKK